MRALFSVFGRIGLDTREYTGAIDDAERHTRRAAENMDRDMGRSLESINQRFDAVGRQMQRTGKQLSLKVTAPLMAIGGAALYAAGQFEASMNRVGALTEATGDQMDRLQAQARELGATTAFSASQAADAMGFLAMAGFEVEEIIAAMPGTLQLAAAGQMELAQAADIASNVLTGFGLEAAEIGRVNDVLAKTAVSANTDIAQMGEAMKYVAPVAAGLGISVEETAAGIGMLSNAGIQASSAGTGMRQIFSTLVLKTDELGISVRDSAGNMRPMSDILDDLAAKGFTAEEAMSIFGQRGGPALMALLGQGGEAMRRFTDELENAGGTAERIADAQMQGLIGAKKELASAAEAVGIAIAESGLLEWATNLARGAANLLRQLADLDPAIVRIGTVVALAAAAVGPLLITLGGILRTIPLITTAVGALRVASLPFLGPAGILLAVAGGVAYLATKFAGERGALKESVQEAMGELTEDDANLATSLDIIASKARGPTRDALRELQDELTLSADTSAVIESLDDVIEHIDDDTAEALTRLRDRLILESNPEPALAALDAVIEKSDGEVAAALGRVRDALVIDGDVSAALEEFDRIIAGADDEVRPALERIRTDLELEANPADVLEAFDAIIEAADDDVRPALERIRADLIQTGNVGVEQAMRIAGAMVQAVARDFGADFSRFGDWQPVHQAFIASGDIQGQRFQAMRTALDEGRFNDAIGELTRTVGILERALADAAAQGIQHPQEAMIRGMLEATGEFQQLVINAMTQAMRQAGAAPDFRDPGYRTGAASEIVTPPPPVDRPPPTGTGAADAVDAAEFWTEFRRQQNETIKAHVAGRELDVAEYLRSGRWPTDAGAIPEPRISATAGDLRNIVPRIGTEGFIGLPSRQIPHPIAPEGTVQVPMRQIPHPVPPEGTIALPSRQIPQPVPPEGRIHVPGLREIPEPDIAGQVLAPRPKAEITILDQVHEKLAAIQAREQAIAVWRAQHAPYRAQFWDAEHASVDEYVDKSIVLQEREAAIAAERANFAQFRAVEHDLTRELYAEQAELTAAREAELGAIQRYGQDLDALNRMSQESATESARIAAAVEQKRETYLASAAGIAETAAQTADLTRIQHALGDATRDDVIDALNAQDDALANVMTTVDMTSDEWRQYATQQIAVREESRRLQAEGLRETADGLLEQMDAVRQGTPEWEEYREELERVYEMLQALGFDVPDLPVASAAGRIADAVDAFLDKLGPAGDGLRDLATGLVGVADRFVNSTSLFSGGMEALAAGPMAGLGMVLGDVIGRSEGFANLLETLGTILDPVVTVFDALFDAVTRFINFIFPWTRSQEDEGPAEGSIAWARQHRAEAQRMFDEAVTDSARRAWQEAIDIWDEKIAEMQDPGEWPSRVEPEPELPGRTPRDPADRLTPVGDGRDDDRPEVGSLDYWQRALRQAAAGEAASGDATVRAMWRERQRIAQAAIDLIRGEGQETDEIVGLIANLQTERTKLLVNQAQETDEAVIRAINLRIADINEEIRRLQRLGLEDGQTEDAVEDIREELDRIDFGGVPQTIQFAVATPLAEAADRHLEAVEKFSDTLDRLLPSGPGGMSGFVRAIDRQTPVLERLTDTIERLLRDGVHIGVDIAQATTTGSPTAALR